MSFMSKMVKFASQIDEAVLRELRALASQTDKSISKLLTEAVTDYLKRARVRPEFAKATERILSENSELLKRLAK
jgi:hypothetical protein